ncbi:MAG: TatD family nuclease-associated radical SAM protein [Pseudomonadales bacterium]|nr:TatD family nuclease-associated radical SAM protein [Pseudomonadales bacterium]
MKYTEDNGAIPVAPLETPTQTEQPILVYDIDGKRYINLTNACTLKCKFCPKHNGSWNVKGYELALDFNPKANDIIDKLGDLTEIEEVVFCGFGESTLRLKELINIATHLKQWGKKTRLNTDGLGNLVHHRNILPDLTTCVDALSISLNAQNEEVYEQHCCPTLSGSYEALLGFIKAAPTYIDDVTVTAIEGLEGVDVHACENLAEQFGVKFRKRYLDEVG